MAKDLGIPISNLHRWRRQYRNAPTQAFPGKGHQSDQDEEMRRLRKEVATLKQERDILKKRFVFQRRHLSLHSGTFVGIATAALIPLSTYGVHYGYMSFASFV